MMLWSILAATLALVVHALEFPTCPLDDDFLSYCPYGGVAEWIDCAFECRFTGIDQIANSWFGTSYNTPSGELADGTITADLTYVAQRGTQAFAGLYFRIEELNCGYFCSESVAYGVQLSWAQDAVKLTTQPLTRQIEIVPFTPGFEVGGTYRLEVTIIGYNVVVKVDGVIYIDHTFDGSANEPLIQTGGVGVTCRDGDSTIANIQVDLAPETCEESAIATFNWDDLTMTGPGAGKPEVVAFNMSVDQTDLSLNIEIALPYVGRSSADIYDSVYGTTYVLDFEDFAAHADSIAQPGTCQNRRANDFTDAFSTFWDYSLSPAADIGSAEFLAYPPPGDLWSVASDVDDECGVVVYTGKFTWNDLVACTSFDSATDYITPRDGGEKLTLQGTFYVNVVSPFAYASDTGYYRVYQLLSQPFVISVNKNLQVLGAAGINLFTVSVIAVYKEADAALFKLIVLTESAEYLQLSRTGLGAGLAMFISSSAENGAPQAAEFTVALTSENGDANGIGCLNNKAYICSQLWQIEAPGDCSSDQSQYIDFSGNYTLQFTPVCRSAADLGADGAANGTALNQYCGDWLIAHPDEAAGVGLTASLQWRDEECDPILFEVQFEAEMLFYTDDAFTSEAGSTLYQVGEDRIYAEVDTVFPEGTYDVFDTTLLNVWICTFDPLTPPLMPIEASELSGGCFSGNIDGANGGEFGVDNKYAYHIYDADATVTVPELIAFDLVGHPVAFGGQEENDKVRFSFVVPSHIARDTLYVHAQLEVSLTTGGARRRQLLSGPGAIANQMEHFLGNVGVSDQPQKRPVPHQHHEPLRDVPSVGGENYVLSLQSPLVMAFAGLLGVILTFNIVFMAVRCCSGGQRARVSIGGRSKRNYKPVNVADSEVDDSEAQLNVVSE